MVEPASDIEHQWVGAAQVLLHEKAARRAARRGNVVVEQEAIVQVVEVYCTACKVTFERGRNTFCPIGSIHLRGGPIGERKKRKGILSLEVTSAAIATMSEDVRKLRG